MDGRDTTRVRTEPRDRDQDGLLRPESTVGLHTDAGAESYPIAPGDPMPKADIMLCLTAQEISELRAFCELLDRWDREHNQAGEVIS